MSKALTLTIVIPVYNEDSYIGDCLKAISEQSVMPDEVIVVDNNSVDNTLEIAHQYNFVTVINESRQGVRYANEAGMNMVSSDIIARIDADTLLSHDWCENVINIFSDSSITAATGPVGYYDFICPEINSYVTSKMMYSATKLGYKFLFGCNMAVRKQLWDEVKSELCHDDTIFEDIDLALHLQDFGYQPSFHNEMNVMVSSRRLSDTPTDFYRYIKGHSRTSKLHNKRNRLVAYYSEASYLLGYLLFKPLHMVYDPSERKIDFMRLKYNTRRPNPMGYNPNSLD